MTTTNLSSDLVKFLESDLKLSKDLIQWIESRYERILAGDAEEWYITFLLTEGAKRRKIESPDPDLKKIQRKILERFLYRFKASNNAHGFVQGKSPVTNARVHAEHRAQLGSSLSYCALMIDVKDFFHGITERMVWTTLSRILAKRTKIADQELRTKIADLLSGLCVKDGRLPMGAPTSPALSNLVMVWFDIQMDKYAKAQNLCYTRYADDIVISGPRANRAYPKLESELTKLGLAINGRKTRVRRPHRALDITGVVINSGVPTVSRKYRRILRAALHNTQLFVEGAFTPLAKDPQPEQLTRLAGRASWCAFVNPKHAHLAAKAKRVKEQWEESR